MLLCWRCGGSLEKLSLPLSRLDECPECGIYVHVCRMCNFYDPAVTKACREDDADEIKEKERANFCDYFSPTADAFDAQRAAAEQKAADQLGSLFGDSNEGPSVPAADDDSAAQAADDLFKKS